MDMLGSEASVSPFITSELSDLGPVIGSVSLHLPRHLRITSDQAPKALRRSIEIMYTKDVCKPYSAVQRKLLAINNNDISGSNDSGLGVGAGAAFPARQFC